LQNASHYISSHDDDAVGAAAAAGKIFGTSSCRFHSDQLPS
jgi:hypothetical protein